LYLHSTESVNLHQVADDLPNGGTVRQLHSPEPMTAAILFGRRRIPPCGTADGGPAPATPRNPGMTRSVPVL